MSEATYEPASFEDFIQGGMGKPIPNRGSLISEELKATYEPMTLSDGKATYEPMFQEEVKPAAGMGGVKATDLAKSGAAGALSGAGMIAQGGGELLSRGINIVGGKLGFDPQLRAENPMQGWINSILDSRTPAAKKAEAESQISGEWNKPESWNFGTDPSTAGIALQGLNAIGQFMPNLAIALVTAGASIPAQLATGAVVGGIQALGGGAEQERSVIQGRTHEQLMAGSKLYAELINRGVPQDQAKDATADAAALGGGLGNAIPSAAEGAFENFLIGALTKGRIRIPSLGAGMAGRVATGLVGGAAAGGTEEAVEQMGQNIGSNIAIGGDRPISADTLQNFIMGAIAEGAVGGGAGALTSGSPAAQTPAPAQTAPSVVPQAQPASEAPPAPAGEAIVPRGTIEPEGLPILVPGQPTYGRTAEPLSTEPIDLTPINRIDQARADAQILKSGQELIGADDVRTRNATLMSVYGENAAVRHVIEGGPQFSAIGDAMLLAAPTVERVRGTIAANERSRDISTDILQAVDEIAQIKAQGGSVAKVLAEGAPNDISFEGQQLMQFLDDNAGNPKRIANFLENYLQEVENATGQPSEVRGRAFDIIEERRLARKEAEQKSKVEAFAKAEKAAKKEQTRTTIKATEQNRAQKIVEEMVRAKAAGSGIQPQHKTAIELAFENAKKLKGKPNAKPSPEGPKPVQGGPSGGTEGGAAKPQKPTGPTSGEVPVAAEARDTGNTRQVHETGDQQSAGEIKGAVNRGKAIAAELKPIDQAAHEAATSPKNDLPQPTEAQREAGNYKKGPVRINGMDISIENPAGSKRRPEWPTLQSHYGYVKDVAARAPDKEHVDVFVKPGTSEDHAGPVFVVDQNKANGKFDEPKTMIGYANKKEAKVAYLKNYEKGWESRIRGITEMSTEQFKEKLQDAKAFLNPQEQGAKAAETFAGKYGEGMNEVPARQQQKELSAKRPELDWKVEPSGLKYPYVVKGYAREIEAKPNRGAQIAAELSQPRPTEAEALDLRRMAGEAGWAQVGGKLIRTGEGANAEEMAMGRGAEFGEVTGRAQWIPNQPWFQAMRTELGGKGLSTKSEITKAVEDYTSGKKLSANARRTIDWMLAEAKLEPEHMAEEQAGRDVADKAVAEASDNWHELTEEQKDEKLDAIFGKDSRPAAGAAETPKAASEGKAGQETLELKGETPAELKAKESKQVEADKAEAEAERKAIADEGVAGFGLTGSDRAADVGAVAGQKGMFEQGIAKYSIEITPAMREKIAGGLPLFSRSESEGKVPEEFTIDEANREKTKALEKQIKETDGYDFTITPVSSRTLPDNVANDARGRATRGGPSNSRELAERISGLFGKQIIWSKIDGQWFMNGVTTRGGEIVINVASSHPEHVVLGHELTHHIEWDTPVIYEKLVKAMQGLLRNHEEYRRSRKIDVNADVSKEMIGDLMGDNFDNPQFWRDVAKESKGSFREIANTVKRWLDRLISLITVKRGFESDQFVTDIHAARKALAQALAEYGGNRGEKIAAELGAKQEPKFSRERGKSKYQSASAAFNGTKGSFAEKLDAAKEAGYKSTAQKIVDRVDQALNPLGELPEQKEYLTKRYLAQGLIEKADESAKGIRDAFNGATEADKTAIYEYLTSAGSSPNGIADGVIRVRAEKIKADIGRIGDELVSKGLLSADVREQYRDAYLPRLYLKHLLSEQDWKGLGAGKKPSDMGYLKKRKDIPDEVRKVILGEITDPGFLAGVAIAKPARDMALLDWLDQISQNQKWVLPGTVVEFTSTVTGRTTKATPFWLKEESARLRKQARYYTEENAAKAEAEAKAMDRIADDALESIQGEHSDYKAIPNTARYGRLRGLSVRTEIYDDLMGVNDFLPTDSGWFQNVFGYGGVGTRATQIWKGMKVSMNPPSQVRNFISNGILMQLSGVPLRLVPARVMQAIEEIRTNGQYAQIAKKHGIGVSTFATQEVYRMKTELLDLELKTRGMGAMGRLHRLAAVIMNGASDFYQLSETIFKTGLIIDGMKRQGMSESDAVQYANKWLFDYSLIQKSARYARNAPIGVPFLTFSLKVLPRLIEVAALHPQRFLPWAALFYGAPMIVASMLGVDDDDLDKLKKALPQWLQDKGHTLILPFKDDNGRWQVVDLGYFMPWGMWTELIGNIAEGEAGKAVQSAGIFGGPLTDLVIAIKTGKDPFTGRDIYAKGDPPERQATAIVNYLWNIAVPPFLTDHGLLSPMGIMDEAYGGKVVQAITGTTNKWGEPRSTASQAALYLIGINVQALTPEYTRTTNVQAMTREMQDVRRQMIYKLQDRALTSDQRKGIVVEYGEELLRRGQKLQQYLKDSQINPTLH